MMLTVIAGLIVAVLTDVSTAGPLVQTLDGRIEGKTERFQEKHYLNVDKNIDVFRGIPYAEPPVDDRRFRPPVPVVPWSGTLATSRHGAACVQSFISFTGMDEDCLFLNVYRPHTASKTAAVMVFIHGGAFYFGMGSMPEYFGQPISTVGDIIYVSINYRLGPFGFLTTGDSEAPGNVGLLDQLLALKWVKNNIARFGGDADKITIFGESAGAASVSFHLVSKQSVGLFNQAIMQSGTSTTFFAYQRSMDYAKKQARDVAVEAGCPTVSTATMISCLQKIPSRKLRNFAYEIDMAYLPVVDGFFLHDKPENIIANGDFQKVDILIGTMKDEGTLVALVLDLLSNYLSKTAPPMSKLEFLDTYMDWVFTYGDVRNNNALKQAIETRYITPDQIANPNSDYLQNFVDIMTDYTWLAPVDVTARAHLNASTKVFMYEMTQVPTVSIFHVFMFGPDWMGAAHADDLPFVFGNSWIPEVFYKSGKPKPEERMLSHTIMKYWTNFAKTGDPSGDGIVPHWPEFTLDKMEYKELSTYLPTKSGGVRQEYSKFWNEDARNFVTTADADTFFSSRGIEAFIQAGAIVEQFKSSY